MGRTGRERDGRGAAAPFSYAHVGATRGQPPAGYRVLRRDAVVGFGRAAFDGAAEQLLTWQVHRAAGLSVASTEGRVRTGAPVRLGLRVGPVTVGAPCRVVEAVEGPGVAGLTYGTLDGHPERGESSFELTIDAGGAVRFRVLSFSRPGRWWSRLGGPVTRRIQDRVTDRYVLAVRAAGSLADPTLPEPQPGDRVVWASDPYRSTAGDGSIELVDAGAPGVVVDEGPPPAAPGRVARWLGVPPDLCGRDLVVRFGDVILSCPSVDVQPAAPT